MLRDEAHDVLARGVPLRKPAQRLELMRHAFPDLELDRRAEPVRVFSRTNRLIAQRPYAPQPKEGAAESR